MANRSARIIVSVIDKASKGFLAIAGSMKILGAAAVALGVYALGKHLVGGLVAATKVAASFDEQMSNILAVTGANTEEMGRLSKQARELGKSTVFTANQIAQGQAQLSRSGFEVSETLDAMTGIVNLAGAASVSVGEAAEIAANQIRTFGLEASASTDVADLLALAANSANTTITDMAEAMKFMGSAASLSGMSMTEAAAAIQLVSDRGMQGSVGGTALAKMLTTMMGAVNKLEGAGGLKGLEQRLFTSEGRLRSWAEIVPLLKEAGIDATNVFQVFGVRAGKAAGFVGKFGKELEGKTIALLNRAGVAAKTSATKLDNLAGDTQLLNSAWTEMNIVIGSLFQDSARIFIRQITFVIEQLTSGGHVSDLFGGAVIWLGETLEKVVGKVLNAISTLTRYWANVKFIGISALQAISDLGTFVYDFIIGPFSAAFKVLGKFIPGLSSVGNALDNVSKKLHNQGDNWGEWANDTISDNMLLTHSIENIKDGVDGMIGSFKASAAERAKARNEAMDKSGLPEPGAADAVEAPGARGTGMTPDEAAAEERKKADAIMSEKQALLQAQIDLESEFSVKRMEMEQEALRLQQETELGVFEMTKEEKALAEARHLLEIEALRNEHDSVRAEADAADIARRATLKEIALGQAQDEADRLAEIAENGTAAQLMKAESAIEAEKNLALEGMILRHSEEMILRVDQMLETETLEAAHKAALLKLEEDFQRRKLELRKVQAQNSMDSAKEETATLKQQFDQTMAAATKLFGDNKALAIANAVISTSRGIAKAQEWGMPLGPIYGAIIAANGLKEIKKIRAQKPQGKQFGGIVNGPPGIDRAFLAATPGELVADTTAAEGRAILSGQAAIVPAGQAGGGGGVTYIVNGDILDPDEFFTRHAQSIGRGMERLDEDGGLI